MPASSSHAADSGGGLGTSSARRSSTEVPERVFLVSYPKVVFLYPTFLAAVVAAIWMGFFSQPLDPAHKSAAVISILFLGLLAINLVILAFDFPRTTSLTLFFFVAAVVMGLVLLFTFRPELWPKITHVLDSVSSAGQRDVLLDRGWHSGGDPGGGLAGGAVRLLGSPAQRTPASSWFLSNLERLAAPNLRIDKEINDIFEYLLLRSGRLILQASNERRAIILDNVPFITKKEEDITRMLGALQVQVRPEGDG